jgi:hypothetical protein
MVRVAGIEPASQPWEGHILPLNYTRINGADKRIRTADLRFTKAPLYQLSYIGMSTACYFNRYGGLHKQG